jgi:ribonuclease R
MNAITLEEQVLRLVNAAEYKPAKPRAICRLLKLADDEYPTLRRTIRQLARTGKLTYAANHLVHPRGSTSGKTGTAGRADEVQGTFRANRNGYGFVRPMPGSQWAEDEDIFIPAQYVRSAMDGDVVSIRVRSGRDTRWEGTVQEIVTRGRRQFTGTFRTVEGKAIVWLDGVDATQPLQIGDVRGLPVEESDKVVVEVVRYPEGLFGGEGIILEVLGSSKNPAVDTMAVMRQFDLVEHFPDEVIDQARSMADRFQEDAIPPERRDLTAVPTITIDPYDARDFDDAISLSQNEVGHWVLQVHIADVGAFVPAGTPLDQEAQARATSVYLPDKVIPMLPEIISNHLASLQPDRNRWAKTVLMEMTSDGVMVHWEVFNSVIRNIKRLNYEQVDDYLAHPDAWETKLSPEVFQLLRDMHTLAMTLKRRRQRNGTLELVLPEVKIDLDRGGKVKGAHLVLHTESHQVIEEFMLAANQTVASWLDQLQLPFLRRAHAPPKPNKLKQLTQFVRELEIPCEDLESRFEIQRVIDQVRGTTTEYAVNYAVLKSMAKAVYQVAMERHYALNMTHYCHFTSPIRRYPDLVVHRIVDHLIAGQVERPSEEVLERLGQHCSDQEQNAEAAERELIHVKLLHFLNKRIGQRVPGTITAVRPEGFVVRGIDLPAEGFVSIDALPPDRYRYERAFHQIIGFRNDHRYRLGDQVVAVVDKVDLERRLLWFVLDRAAPVVHASKLPRRSSHRPRHEGGPTASVQRGGRGKRTSKGAKRSSIKKRPPKAN